MEPGSGPTDAPSSASEGRTEPLGVGRHVGHCRFHAARDAVDVCAACRAELCLTCAGWLAGATYCPNHFAHFYRRRQLTKVAAVVLALGLGLAGWFIYSKLERAKKAEAERYGERRAEVERLRSAMAQDHCNRPNAKRLAELLEQSGHVGEAAQALDAVVDGCPPERALTEQALALHRKAGDRGASAALADQLIKEHPEAASGYGHRGALRQEVGDTSAALVDFRQALRLDPGLDVAARGLAELVETREPCTAADALDDFLGFASPDDAGALRLRSDRLRERGGCRRERIEGGKAVVPFRREQDVMVVDVIVGDIHAGRMLLDTGASTVAITAAFAERVGLDWRDGETFYVGTAGGVTTAHAVRLDSLSLGAARVDGVQAAVVSHMSLGEDVDGLLGNTFLSHFEVVVDAAKRQITLSPRTK